MKGHIWLNILQPCIHIHDFHILRLFLHFLGKHVFASLVVVYRYGRQEDELIPGLSFMKEMVCDRVQVYPEYQGEEISKFQVKRDKLPTKS